MKKMTNLRVLTSFFHRDRKHHIVNFKEFITHLKVNSRTGKMHKKAEQKWGRSSERYVGADLTLVGILEHGLKRMGPPVC